MSNYRDDRDALRSRSEVLEQDLAQKQREIDELRAGGPPAERLERLAHDLAAAQAEIGRMRAQMGPAPSRAPVVVAAIVGTAVIVGGVAMIAARGRVEPPVAVAAQAPPPPPEAPPPVVPPPPPPGAIATAPPAPTAPAASEAAAEEKAIEAVWKGKVRTAKGVQLAPGTACKLTASITGGGKVHIRSASVTCGATPLYSSQDKFNGMSNSSSGYMEQQLADKRYVRALSWKDTGSRSGRNEISVDTTKHAVRVWDEGAPKLEVEITIDEFDAPTTEPVDPASAHPVCPAEKRAARVTEATGAAGVKVGASCEVVTQPSGQKCRVRVACGPKALYNDGYAGVTDGVVLDDKTTPEDKDPRVKIDGDDVEVGDEGATTWQVKLSRAAAKKKP